MISNRDRSFRERLQRKMLIDLQEADRLEKAATTKRKEANLLSKNARKLRKEVKRQEWLLMVRNPESRANEPF